jgi:hypothetical protein
MGKTASPAGYDENLPFGLAAIGGICAIFLFIRRNGNGKA